MDVRYVCVAVFGVVVLWNVTSCVLCRIDTAVVSCYLYSTSFSSKLKVSHICFSSLIQDFTTCCVLNSSSSLSSSNL